jgi:hypothetical protein
MSALADDPARTPINIPFAEKEQRMTSIKTPLSTS